MDGRFYKLIYDMHNLLLGLKHSHDCKNIMHQARTDAEGKTTQFTEACVAAQAWRRRRH